MSEIHVTPLEENGTSTYSVKVLEGKSQTNHRVTVPEDIIQKLDLPESTDPQRLIEESFRFLLEREGKESILSSFELMVIARYFPEYPEKIREILQEV